MAEQVNCPTCQRNISKLGCWHCGTFRSKAEVQREYQKNYQRKYTKLHDRRPYWKEYYRLKKERKSGPAANDPAQLKRD